MGRGRKSLCTPERVEIITKAIADGKTYKDAYTLAGIGKDAFYEWINNKPEFADAVKRPKAFTTNGTIQRWCKIANVRCVIWYWDSIIPKSKPNPELAKMAKQL